MISEISCFYCKNIVQQQQFKQHIRSCANFQGLVLKSVRKSIDALTPIQLKFLKAELEVCEDMVNKKIPGKMEVFKKVSFIENSVIRIEIEPIVYSGISEQQVLCKKCSKVFFVSIDNKYLFYVQQCWHVFCRPCIIKHANQEFVNAGGKLQCLYPGCKKAINHEFLGQMLGQRFTDMETRALRKAMNIVACFNCATEYEFVPGNPRDAPAKAPNGRILSAVDRQFYAQNRFMCLKAGCNTEQCRQCRLSPFHTGYSCQQYQKRAELVKCRCCGEPISEKSKLKESSSFQFLDICSSEQCRKQAASFCTKTLACGHPCSGFRGETTCLPCLYQPCCEGESSLNQQKGDDYCNICFVESLSASACIQSTCGHIFHEKCLLRRYEIRWITPRIFFNFCCCPLCKRWINVVAGCKLAPHIEKNFNLFKKLQGMALERLKFQECLKDERLTNPQSSYFNKPTEYAMAIYAYFQCFKCKNPYFGGRKSCAEAMNEPQNLAGYKPEELVCPNCCDIPIENCPKHGKEFIQFKCKFCCSIAQWFCWGNTHFCDSCHKRQIKGDYVNKYPVEKLPKCQGPGLCPVGAKHGGNGQEISLGCTICRNYKANNRQF